MSARCAPRLIAISDVARAGTGALLDRLEALAAGARPGSVLLQLRDRELPLRERRALGEQLRALSARHEQWLAVNDRLDLALLLGADAVHLGEASVSVIDARSFAAAHRRAWSISVACHDPERARSAAADALLLSPVVLPRKGRLALGSAGVRAARRALELRAGAGSEDAPCLLYALGGVTRHEARALCQAGADGVAVIGELFEPGGVDGLIAALAIAR